MKINIEAGDVLTGSSRLFVGEIKENKTDYQIRNMAENKVVKYLVEKGGDRADVVKEQTERYRKYRNDWKNQPKQCITNQWSIQELKEKRITPLCIDLETTAICDLACPFCHRQFLATPDKLITEDLCYRLIDEASALNVPSIKFNVRGEPLLHPKLSEFIQYAKLKGILETSINTNATHLTEKTSRKLIESGLDVIIYSFDGATKMTYEKMRPGRFRPNMFEDVISNIVRFSEIRSEMNSVFPYSKIQMILTKDTYQEQEQFIDLFHGCVDDVGVSQYQERGGQLKSLGEPYQTIYMDVLEKRNLRGEIPHRLDADGTFYIAENRIPCDQPFQRLMVTYEGRVGMCCIDWGATHTLGYVDDLAFSNFSEYEKVFNKARNKKKGYEMLENVAISKEFDVQKVEPLLSLKEIWYGEILQKVRESHYRNMHSKIRICKNCSSTDTYQWQEVG